MPGVSPRQKVSVLHALQADVLIEASRFLRQKSALSILKQDISSITSLGIFFCLNKSR
jgi:hypothetical protein